MVGYGEIFSARGDAYDAAMANWPDARAEEFAFAVRVAQIAVADVVVDVPAGGGYLKDHLPPETEHIAVEPSAAFAAGCRRRGVTVVESSLHGDALASGIADVVVSIAGAHHEADHVGLLRSWRRIVRPGGTVALIDVATGSPSATFLDGFVGEHNGEGHDGHYLGPAAGDLALEAGFADVEVIDGEYAWWCPDVLALGAFCRGLFGLGGVEIEEVVEAITDGPGLVRGTDQRRGGERVGMRWGLRAVVARNGS